MRRKHWEAMANRFDALTREVADDRTREQDALVHGLMSALGEMTDTLVGAMAQYHTAALAQATHERMAQIETHLATLTTRVENTTGRKELRLQ